MYGAAILQGTAPGSLERRTRFPRESPRFCGESSLPDLRSRRLGCTCPENRPRSTASALYAMTSLSRSSAARANLLILRVFCSLSPTSRHASPSLRRSRYSFTPDAARCLTSPVCAWVRSLARFEPLVPPNTMEKAIPVCDATVYRSHVGANTYPRFQALGGLESPTQSPTHDHLLARVLQLISQHQFAVNRACGLTGGGFFHDSPGGLIPRRRFPVPAMSAPGIEHRRFSALVRGSMEHTNRYTKEIGTPKRVTRGTLTTGCARE